MAGYGEKMTAVSGDLPDLSRLCRSLASAVLVAQVADPLDDPIVEGVLEEVRQSGLAGRAAQMLGAMVLFTRDRLNLARLASNEPCLSLGDIAEALVSEATLDQDLVEDCFAILRKMRSSGRQRPALRHAIEHAITVWGPYGWPRCWCFSGWHARSRRCRKDSTQAASVAPAPSRR